MKKSRILGLVVLMLVVTVAYSFKTNNHKDSPKFTAYYWYDLNDLSIGGSTYHHSEPTGAGSIAVFLAQSGKTFDTNPSGGVPVAQGFLTDNPNQGVDVTEYRHPN